MAFNPILETNIQPNQTVQKPSAAGAAINLLGGLFPERPKVNPPSRTDVDAEFKQNTLRELSIAAQTGDTTKATNVYRDYSARYGIGVNPEVDSAFSAITNQSPTIATYGGDNSVAKLEASPAYTLGLELARSTSPQASPEELRSSALNYASSKIANEAKLEQIKQNKEITWAEAQVTYDEGFNLTVKAARDMASVINADQVVTPEEAQEFRNFFATELEKFDAPPGVDATTWDTYQRQKMGAFNDLVNTQLNNLMSDGPSKDMPKAMQALFDKLVTQGKLPAGIMYAVQGGGQNGAAVDTMLQLFAGGNESWANKITEVSSMSFEELLQYSKTYEETGPEAFQNSVSKDKISDWANQPDAMIVSSIVDDRANISSADPMISTLAVQAVVEKVNTLEGKSLDGDLLKRTFDAEYFSALERMKSKNPVLGEYFTQRTAEVLANQEAAMLTNMNAVANANGFRIRTVNSQSDFYPDPSLMSKSAMDELNKYFGGDWNKALAADGKAYDMEPRFSGAGGMGGMGGVPGIITPNLMSAFTQIKGLQKSLNSYSEVMGAVDRLSGKPVPTKEEANADNGTGVGVVEAGAGYTVIKFADGTTVRREGTRAWRNNNPGNIEYGDFAKSNGAIGTDGRFAVFPSVEEGRKARAALLFDSKGYKDLTIGQAIARYAPSFENDTNAYTGAITSALGLPASTKLSALSEDERAVMQNAMERVEGFTPGKENGVQSYDTAQANPRVTTRGTPATGPYVPLEEGPFVPTYSPAPMGAPAPTPQVSAAPGNTPPTVDTGYQPTEMKSPESTPQAVQAPYDKEVQSLIDELNNKYQAAKADTSLQFDNVIEMEKARDAGKVKVGDIVLLKGKPVKVY